MNPIPIDIFDGPFHFTKRPEPIPTELRPQWRIATLLLVLSASRSKKASLKKLHVINWAIRNRAAQENLVKYMEGNLAPSTVIVRFEPALARALEMGCGEKLWAIVGGSTVQLTAKGLAASEELESNADCLVAEKTFISRIKSSMTEQKINALLSWEEL